MSAACNHLGQNMFLRRRDKERRSSTVFACVGLKYLNYMCMLFFSGAAGTGS